MYSSNPATPFIVTLLAHNLFKSGATYGGSGLLFVQLENVPRLDVVDGWPNERGQRRGISAVCVVLMIVLFLLLMTLGVSLKLHAVHLLMLSSQLI